MKGQNNIFEFKVNNSQIKRERNEIKSGYQSTQQSGMG
jgi:hypothetical protein